MTSPHLPTAAEQCEEYSSQARGIVWAMRAIAAGVARHSDWGASTLSHGISDLASHLSGATESPVEYRLAAESRRSPYRFGGKDNDYPTARDAAYHLAEIVWDSLRAAITVLSAERHDLAVSHDHPVSYQLALWKRGGGQEDYTALAAVLRRDHGPLIDCVRDRWRRLDCDLVAELANVLRAIERPEATLSLPDGVTFDWPVSTLDDLAVPPPLSWPNRTLGRSPPPEAGRSRESEGRQVGDGAAPHDDGPSEIDLSFWWDRKRFEFPRSQARLHRLLTACWPAMRFRTGLAFEDIRSAHPRLQKVTDKVLKNYAHELNNLLAAWLPDFPGRLVTTDAGLKWGEPDPGAAVALKKCSTMPR